jgi:hypothetical protein
MRAAKCAAFVLAIAALGLFGPPRALAKEDLGNELASATGFCAVDSETPEAARAEPEAVARKFLDAAFGFKPEDAYEELYPNLKEVVSKGEFVRALAPLRDEGPTTRPHLDHFYRVVSRNPSTGGKAICFESESKTARRVFLSQATIPEQAQLVFTADSQDYRWAIVLWLVNARGGWSVLGIALEPEAILGHTSEDFIARGRAEEAKGRAFNATVLYTEGLNLLNRGSSMQLERQQDLLRDLSGFRTAPELGGAPPYRWSWDGQNVFNIHAFSLNAWHGRMAAYVVQSPPNWEGTDPVKADALNRQLIDAFVKAHPEWGDAFDDFVAVLVTANDRPYETAFDKDAGYVKPQ